MRKYQECSAQKTVFCIKVPSASKEGVFYNVKGFISKGDMACDCPAFTYRGKCKHTQLEVVLCGWSGFSSPEPQTIEQKQEYICPVCGGKTRDVVHGGA